MGTVTAPVIFVRYASYTGNMRNNVLLVVHTDKELVPLLNKYRGTYNIYVARNITEMQHALDHVAIQLIICSECVPFIKLSASVQPAMALPAIDFRKQLDDCILNNLHRHMLNADLLARFMNMSRPTLYRKIKNSTGRTPNELIARARLNQAAMLLAAGDYRVFEVAKMVGFSSAGTFGKAFLKLFKVTPTEYKRKHYKV
ncbi:helix-turn-helix domain-containing protein [Longitalea arenae]|uniref:helix-turn-helix domain-containing protein n=1 Tax=Longitalea arenae TaxID=2812558 RepID=UPI0019671474|nr:AraC family transcriptional regulator [Longitalea arenae]